MNHGNETAVTRIFSEPILSAVSWATDTDVSAIWLNRVQNKGAIVSYDSDGNSTIVSVGKRRSN